MNPEDKKTDIDTSKKMKPKQCVKIENSAPWLQEVMAQDISLENIINEMESIILWNYQDGNNGINTQISWIDPNFKKIDKVIFMLRYFFFNKQGFNQFLEYLKENDKDVSVNKLSNIKIKKIIKNYTDPVNLRITEEQYEELVELLDKS